MSIKYYPLTRVKTNLYTRGGQFIAPDGTPYTGRYYLLYDGSAYTGINPVTGANQPLRRIEEPTYTATQIMLNNPSSQTYAATKNKKQRTQSDAELGELVPYFPVPLDSDYARGYFTRYFAKNVTGPGYVVEISQTDWADIQDGNTAQDILAYEATSMLWQLTGPLNDRRVSQYQTIGGVYDTNKRVTEAKAKGFIGLNNYIGGDYTKFAKITP
jgi:hypothetical protein